MQFREGADVQTYDGQKVGDIVRVVLDPVTKEVTHLVVRKGFLLKRDKLVPVDLITSTTEDRVKLRKDVDDLARLPDFEESYYVRVNETAAEYPYPPGYIAPVYSYPPLGYAGWGVAHYPLYPPPPYVLETERNIPERTVPLKEGAEVFSADEEHVGYVERVFTDGQNDRATHILISEGLLLKERKLVPTNWIQEVRENRVRLATTSELIDGLPEYKE